MGRPTVEWASLDVRGKRIRWGNVARLAAILVGGVALLALLPRLLAAPEPPPLPADVGLEPGPGMGGGEGRAADPSRDGSPRRPRNNGSDKGKTEPGDEGRMDHGSGPSRATDSSGEGSGERSSVESEQARPRRVETGSRRREDRSAAPAPQPTPPVAAPRPPSPPVVTPPAPVPIPPSPPPPPPEAPGEFGP